MDLKDGLILQTMDGPLGYYTHGSPEAGAVELQDVAGIIRYLRE